MTIKRLAVLFAVLAFGMSAVFALPKQLFFQPVGINLELPEYVGGWVGTPLRVTDAEKAVLGEDTQFARKSYSNFRGDEVHVSIVLAGQDMNTGIHRPERCLPAQGWTIADKKALTLPVGTAGVLPVTRLHDLRSVKGEDGKLDFTIYNLNYYWFAGHTDVTESHYERTYIDMRDRLVHGYNQRWAYITVAATITDNLRKFGRSEKETDKIIQDFIRQLVPLVHHTSLES